MHTPRQNATDTPARRAPARRGLTLLELMIGLAVLAVLSALAWPSYQGRLARERLNNVAQAMAGDLVEARFEAARRGQPLHVELTAGAQWCWAVATHSGCPCGAPQACQLQTGRAVDHPGVQLLGAGSTRLNADGSAELAVSNAFSATFQNSAQEQLRVSLSPLGRARICMPQGVSKRHPTC